MFPSVPTLQRKSKPSVEMKAGVDALFEVVAFGGDGKTRQAEPRKERFGGNGEGRA
jgi:hypothetical protein